MGVWGFGVKIFRSKKLQDQGKEVFLKRKKVRIEIHNIRHILFQSATEIYFLDF